MKNKFLYSLLEWSGSWVRLCFLKRIPLLLYEKKKIYNPFLELDESWVRPQANLNIPIWKTNFYTSFWNWRISIPLYEKQISILLLELTLFCGWERKTIRLTTSNEFQYSFMESKFLYSFLELDESWVRPQTNFNTPLWKRNFYTPFSN